MSKIPSFQGRTLWGRFGEAGLQTRHCTLWVVGLSKALGPDGLGSIPALTLPSSVTLGSWDHCLEPQCPISKANTSVHILSEHNPKRLVGTQYLVNTWQH